MYLRKAIISGLILLFLPHSSFAVSKDFKETYTYNAGEADSKLTCRTVSLLEVKRLLLEKLGTYLEARTEIADFQIAKDEIVALSAGVVKTEILAEKWDGETYTLTAKIEADPDEVARAIDRLRKGQEGIRKIQKLSEINTEAIDHIRDLQSQMERLQSNLLKVNQDMSANEGMLNAWGMYEKGVRLRQSGKAEEAVRVFNTAIDNNPTHLAFFERGKAYLELGKYDAAVSDFTEALKTEHSMRDALFGRGRAYLKLGNRWKGRRDIEKAADLGNSIAKKWLENHPGRGGF